MDSSSFLAGAGAGRAQATNLVSLLDDSARAFPDKVALRFRGRSFTYAELRGRVDRLAGALASLGCVKATTWRSSARTQPPPSRRPSPAPDWERCAKSTTCGFPPP